MRVGLALLLLLTAGLSVAQQAGRIEGRVLTPDGSPVPKATVRLMSGTPGPNRTQTAYVENTSSDGRFTVEGIAPGTYNATAQRVGYISPNQNQPLQRPVPITVIAGETKSGVVIQLVPLAIVGGTVNDEDGDVVPGAQVRLMRYIYGQGRLNLSAMSAATSDDRGQFRLPNVQPGRYYLIASPSPAFSFSSSGGITEVRGHSAQESNLPTFYPGSVEIRGATLLDVKSTPLENLRIRMLRGKTFTIKGTVSGFAGGTAAGPRATISVIPKGGEMGGPNIGTAVRPAGDFETGGMPPGQYTVLARLNDPSSPAKVSIGRAEVIITNANIEGVALRMSEGTELTGKITMEGAADLKTYIASAASNRLGAAAPPGAVIQGPSRMPTLMMLPAESIPVSFPQIAVKDDGSFRVENVAPMTFMMTVQNLPQGSYVKSLRFNGQSMDGNRLDLSSGSAATVEVVLSPKGASLSFTAPASATQAAQGAPIPQMITVWPEKTDSLSPTGGLQTAFLTPQGNVSFRGLPPGDYFAAIWEEVPSQEVIRIPAFLARFNTQAARVTLKEGESGTVELKTISREAALKAYNEFP